MNIIITCGPSYEPIDQVRRITNFSTGRLGATLATAFKAAGHTVTCYRGELATFPTPPGIFTIPFTTNNQLLSKLKAFADLPADAVFHAAALCDFGVVNPSGHKKIPTQSGVLTLTLEPTTKVLPQLRPLFPGAKIVGWKYELDGSRDDALKKAFTQIQTAQSNACVLNGTAYGDGFGFCENGEVQHLPDLDSLCAHLIRWTTGP